MKRSPKDRDTLSREEGNEATFETVLIVCEGEKTEPNYLKDLLRDLRIPSARVTVCGRECGSDPMSVVKHGEKLMEDSGGAYDRVYYVIDRDSHVQFKSALEKVRGLNATEEKYFSIVSIPCFEFWLVLHFKDTSAPYQAKQGKSVGDAVCSDLDKLIPGGYNKGARDVYKRTQPYITTAITSAKKLEKLHLKSDSDGNPSSQMHHLVTFLKDLSDRMANLRN